MSEKIYEYLRNLPMRILGIYIYIIYFLFDSYCFHQVKLYQLNMCMFYHNHHLYLGYSLRCGGWASATLRTMLSNVDPFILLMAASAS